MRSRVTRTVDGARGQNVRERSQTSSRLGGGGRSTGSPVLSPGVGVARWTGGALVGVAALARPGSRPRPDVGDRRVRVASQVLGVGDRRQLQPCARCTGPARHPARIAAWTVEVEYVEVARAESERGELVLRERRPVDGGPTSLELRANGVFVMDTVEVSTERAMAHAALALVDEPRAVVVGRPGPRLHDARGAGRLPGREVRGGRDRAGAGRVDAGRARARRARRCSPTSGSRVVEADVVVALAEARPASYDLVLLDVDNGPGYLVHAANAALYEPPALTDARRVLRPGGALVVWSAAESPELEDALRAVFDDVEAQPPRRDGSRTATSTTGSTCARRADPARPAPGTPRRPPPRRRTAAGPGPPGRSTQLDVGRHRALAGQPRLAVDAVADLAADAERGGVVGERCPRSPPRSRGGRSRARRSPAASACRSLGPWNSCPSQEPVSPVRVTRKSLVPTPWTPTKRPSCQTPRSSVPRVRRELGPRCASGTAGTAAPWPAPCASVHGK